MNNSRLSDIAEGRTPRSLSSGREVGARLRRIDLFAIVTVLGLAVSGPAAQAEESPVSAGSPAFGLGSGFFLGHDDPLSGPGLQLEAGGASLLDGLDLSIRHPHGYGRSFGDFVDNGFGREPESRPNVMFGGFRFNQHFSVELGVAELEGEERSRLGGRIGTPLGAELGSHPADLSGMSAAVTGALPLGDQVNVFGKAGLFRWELDAARSPTRIDDPEQGRTAANRGYQLQLGIGSDWRLNDRFSFGAQWEYLNDLDAANPTDDHILTGRFKVAF